jgi:D-alanine-D-alanine ligase-like ATP-grasp enzyme
MMNEMGVGAGYAWASFVISLTIVVLAAVHLRYAIHGYANHHDERAAIALAKAVGLVVTGTGVLLSATGMVIEHAMLATAGLSMARGALIVVLATLVLADMVDLRIFRRRE